MPRIYGYDKETAEKLFPIIIFNKCPKNDIINKIVNDNLYLNCEGNGSFISGGNKALQTFGYSTLKYKSTYFKGNYIIDLKNTEYMIITCNLKIKQAFLINRFSGEPSARSKKITAKIASSLNITATKPLGIYMITIDCLSRQHFYRNLPSTVSYLNLKSSISSSNILIYDFLINNAHGRNTMYNMTPLLFGKSFDTHSNITKYLSNYKFADREIFRYIQEHSL